MLTIKDLHVSIDGKEILKGVNLTVNPGEIHAIMGPNGSGKSTLSNVIAGRDVFEVTQGEISFLGKNILPLTPEDRACEGIFLAFQYPVEIPGVSMTNFMKAAIEAKHAYHGTTPPSAGEFLQMIKEKQQLVGMSQSLTGRAVNEGFSGGEKKKNDIFQMAMLDPKLAILDETDSGLDIDALKTVAEGVNTLKTNDKAFIVITHYQRLLDYIIPDFVHVLHDGKIVKSGDKSLALELEEKGYDWIK
ncbi:MAG: Fe-S cluster assembly ATPase SufC [Bacteroidales bacterium]|jgi:Fe-S cluster assembly ATP-binding protein|nr:Fe-S cluster assembly ATPase SufC [Bacteroidales bacterium]NLK81623.1 Fe-S cluster assembly ATPase SufC [Bacteroidales bacterium]HPY81782.1 Fe-S cluster assembly ATPase SufC [Bacteroidales bacterium]